MYCIDIDGCGSNGNLWMPLIGADRDTRWIPDWDGLFGFVWLSAVVMIDRQKLSTSQRKILGPDPATAPRPPSTMYQRGSKDTSRLDALAT